MNIHAIHISTQEIHNRTFYYLVLLNSFNFMKISAAASKQFIDCCSAVGCAVVSDAEAEKTIGAVRELLGQELLASELQLETVVTVLVLFKTLLVEKQNELVSGWSEDEWADAFRELLDACVPHAQRSQSCLDILRDAGRWTEAVEMALRETPEVIEYRVATWWTHKYTATSFLSAVAFVVGAMGRGGTPTTARNKVVSLVISTIFLGVAFFLGGQWNHLLAFNLLRKRRGLLNWRTRRHP